MSPVMEAAALAGRLLLSALFLREARGKLTAYAAAMSYMQAFGVPGQLLPLAIAARAASGHAAAPPSSVMNSRRLTRSPRRPPVTLAGHQT
jgi:uncharacterized membrane protein YphA (DoxX/SURF4 family)